MYEHMNKKEGSEKKHAWSEFQTMMKHHPVLRLKFQHFQNLLKSDNIQCKERDLLWIVLAWSSVTRASKDVTK
jgi:hypothetical protein